MPRPLTPSPAQTHATRAIRANRPTWRRPDRLAALLLALGLGLGLTGCGTATVAEGDFGKYRPAALADSEFLPDAAALRQPRIKAMLLEPEDSEDHAQARRTRPDGRIVATLNTLLGQRGFDLIDPRVAPHLRDQVRLAEARGTAALEGPPAADVALRLLGTSSRVITSTTPARDVKDQKGKVTRVPASTTYQATVQATLHVHEVPSLKLLTSFGLSGSASRTDSSGVIGMLLFDTDGLVKEAATNAVDNSTDELLNHFAFRGHISARRVHEKTSLFLITLGTDHGLRPGDRMQVYSVRAGADDLRRAGPGRDEVLIGEGRISEILTADTAWMAVGDEKVARRVLRGDVVRARHKRGLADLF